MNIKNRKSIESDPIDFNFNPVTGRATLELVRDEVHNATKLHRGGVKQYQNANGGVGYGKK